MTRERALEIITAYGADAARWPADEHDAVLATVAADPELAGARAAAARLDAVLAGWAADVVEAGDAEAGGSAAAAITAASVRPRWRWAGAMALAASLAAGALLWPVEPSPMVPPPTVAPDDTPAFAYLFSPTPDEESLI